MNKEFKILGRSSNMKGTLLLIIVLLTVIGIGIAIPSLLLKLNLNHLSKFTIKFTNNISCININSLINSSSTIYLNITSMYLGLNTKQLNININWPNLNSLNIIITPINVSYYCGALKKFISSVAYFNMTINLNNNNKKMISVLPGYQYRINIGNVELVIPVQICNKNEYYMMINIKG